MSATQDLNNYWWLMSESKFIYGPTRSLFDRPAVARQIGAEAALIVEKDRVCSNLTWMPGWPTIIEDTAIDDGEIVSCKGNRMFNKFRPAPKLSKNADPTKVERWLDLGRRVLSEDDHERLLDTLAFKAQNPAVKINHAIVLGSFAQGIGKDLLLSSTRRAFGYSNWRNIGASQAMIANEKGFNPFLQKLVCRFGEAHDLGSKRFAFYDQTKDWAASPPEMLEIADKHEKARPIMNALLPIYTTNHKADGLFIPADDRRMDVMWSDAQPGHFPDGFWKSYVAWMEQNEEHIAAFLMARDVSKFDHGAPAVKTAAWHQIVQANAEPQDADLSRVLEEMATWDLVDYVPVLTIERIVMYARLLGEHALADYFTEAKNRRSLVHRLERADYSSVANPGPKDGLWRVNGRKQMIYAHHNVPRRDQLRLAEELCREGFYVPKKPALQLVKA